MVTIESTPQMAAAMYATIDVITSAELRHRDGAAYADRAVRQDAGSGGTAAVSAGAYWGSI